MKRTILWKLVINNCHLIILLTTVLLQRVILDRSVGKLGLSIIGGSEHASRIFGGGRPGVYISKVCVCRY